MEGMIDWRLADRVAKLVAATTPAEEGRRDGVAAEVEGFAARSAELVGAYTGLDAGPALPAAETVDRSGWATTNLRSMRSVLEPLVERAGSDLGPLGEPVRAVAGTLLAVEAGALSGFLATRVLGQYEFPILDPAAGARLLFVGPNLAQAIRTLKADEATLVRWVALHETTHALQFGGVPWLREHLAGRVSDLLSTTDVSLDLRRLGRLPGAEDLRALVEAIRREGLITVLAGPERREALDAIQATMALLEGYAEHVMDAVGAQELEDLPKLREGLERRRKERSGFLRVVEKLIGFDLKLRQYEQGKAFCDAVVAEGGIEGLNHAWDAPASLPTVGELDRPLEWLARVA